MPNSKVFCNVPWYKLYIRSTGHYAICCVQPSTDLSSPTIKEITPIEWFNHDKFKQTRLAVLGDEPIVECNKVQVAWSGEAVCGLIF